MKKKSKNDMSGLSSLGWKNQCDTFDTYYKKIGDYEILVSKHIKSRYWTVSLIDRGFQVSPEITINRNATFEWVVELTGILSNCKK